jgi:predicted Rossmann fold nucleotide-binding protein DprA/Smf involved in DNA uptake
MRYAFVGSRSFKSLELIEKYIEQLEPDSVVVSGGAVGVDSHSAFLAKERGLTVVVYKPKWKDDNGVYNPNAAFERNKDIIAASDEVFAFWDGKSRGTLDSIKHALQMGKPCIVILEDGSENVPQRVGSKVVLQKRVD